MSRELERDCGYQVGPDKEHKLDKRCGPCLLLNVGERLLGL